MKEGKLGVKECIKWSEDKLADIISIYRGCLIVFTMPVVLIDVLLCCLIEFIFKDWYYVGYCGLVMTSLLGLKVEIAFIVWLILEVVNFIKKKKYMIVCIVSIILCVILFNICRLEIDNKGGISRTIGAVKDFTYVYNNSYTEEIQTFIGVSETKTYSKGSTTGTSYEIVTTEMRFNLNCYVNDKEFVKKFMGDGKHGKSIIVRYLPNSKLLLEAEIIN